jgi:hypothetical protein
MPLLVETIAGPRPRAKSMQMIRWKKEAPLRVLELCPVTAQTNYYFDSVAGNDTTGQGTEASPWATVAKAEQVKNDWSVSSGRLGLRFKCNSIFNELTELVLNKSYVTASSYGVGRKALANWFTLKVAANVAAWTSASPTRWTTTLAALGTLRRQDFRYRALRRVASTAEVDSTPWSWFQSGTTVSVHVTNSAGTAVNPNSFAWEGTPAGSAGVSFIRTTPGASFVRVHGLAAHGQGYVGFEDGLQNYGFEVGANGEDVVCVTNFEALFHNRHSWGHNAGGSNSNTGGLTLFSDGLAGQDWAQDATIGISYAGGGGQEMIAVNISTPWGAVPNDATRNYPAGVAYYCHCNTGGFHPAFQLVDGLTLPKPPHGYGCAQALHFGDLDEAPSIDDRIAYEFGTKVPPMYGFGNGYVPWIHNAFQANREIYLQPRDDGGETMANVSSAAFRVGGTGENDVIVADLSNIPSTKERYGLFNPTAPTVLYSPAIEGSHVEWYNPNGVGWGTTFDHRTVGLCYDMLFGASAANAQGSAFVNSIMSVRRDDPTNVATPSHRLGLLDTSQAIRNSAFWGMTPGTIAGQNGQEAGVNTVQLDAAPILLGQPTVGVGQLAGRGEAGLCEYDHYERPRSASAPTIGPVEAIDESLMPMSPSEFEAVLVAAVEANVDAQQPRVNMEPDPGFTLQIGSGADGTYKAFGIVRLNAGPVEDVYVFIDMKLKFGAKNFVRLVGEPVVSTGLIAAAAVGPRDTYAVVKLSGVATASEATSVRVPVTMVSGTTVPVVFDLKVFAE